MFEWVNHWWSGLLGCFRRPVQRHEAVRLAVRALRSLEEYPILLSPDELPAHSGKPVYLLTNINLPNNSQNQGGTGGRRRVPVG